MNDPRPEPSVARHYPVLIIGAGINGIGVFRDLCLQGVDCLLVDRGDFCSGASEASSRLMHGGLKYLETGEFRLVRQSAQERNILLRNAPHYVTPLETVLPVRSWFGGILPSILRFFGRKVKMNDRGALITKLGLGLYDVFGRQFRTLPVHVMKRRKAVREAMPDLDPRIKAIGIYYEAQLSHAERLGLELVQDGLADNPASRARNYAAVHAVSGGAFEIVDVLNGETEWVTADVVVNAGGAWIDEINAALGLNNRYMGGTKGSHVVVDNPKVLEALKGRMIYFGSADGRVNLLYPFNGKVLIGSTDIAVGAPDDARVEEAEIVYLISVVGEVFPEIRIARSEVVYSFCGVRPLPRADVADPGEISRDHSTRSDRLPGTNVPVLSLIGGKWTTYRGFAEEAANIVLGRLSRRRLTGTRHLPIGGGRGFPTTPTGRQSFVARLSADHGVPMEVAERLLRRYGTEAARFAKSIAASDHRALASIPEYAVGEIEEIARSEHVRTSEDILRRRTDIALTGQAGKAVRDEVEAILANTFQKGDSSESLRAS